MMHFLSHQRIGEAQTRYAGQAESYSVRALGKFPMDFAEFDRKALSLAVGPW
jgi:hypothetical protein